MSRYIKSVLLWTFISPIIAISPSTSPSYWAGVVEFSSEQSTGNATATMEKALAAYLDIIESKEAEIVDILVFPESTLNSFSHPVAVPDPDLRIPICNNTAYDPMMQRLACSAQSTRKYIVINLTEREVRADRNWHFNTNVVFDRTGTVVSRYRKWNLYGELNMDVTNTSDVSYFTTDFGVTFGHFICFDLMFQTPALTLVGMNVTDIIFPAMWFAQLPFLTALQVQSMWAYKQQVNLLAAGASNPSRGSSGTGIYSGNVGPLKSLLTPIGQRKLLVAEVTKKQYWNESATPTEFESNYTQSQMSSLFLKRDNLELYKSVVFRPSEAVLMNATSFTTVCYETHCCDFDITHRRKVRAPATKSYHYRLAAYEGVKSQRGTLGCSLVACLDDSLASCGLRFAEEDVISEDIEFQSISIMTHLRERVEGFPNTLRTDIRPLSYDDVRYEESPVFKIADKGFRTVTISLLKPHADLYTFGIFGRDFDKDTRVDY